MPAPPGPRRRSRNACNPGAKMVLVEEIGSISYLTKVSSNPRPCQDEGCDFSGMGTSCSGKSGTITSHKAPDKDRASAPACGGRVKKKN